MPDLSQAVKAKVLAALDAALPPLVPASSIFPRQVKTLPDIPFIRYEADAQFYEHSCGQGIHAMVRLHVFADGEAQCEAICAALVAPVSNIPDVQSAQWQGTQFLPDAEADLWHGIVDFRIIHTN